MGKVWVLQTQTKGTGATVVPLEQGPPGSRAAEAEPLFVAPKRRSLPAEAPAPEPPRRFRVLDVVTRQVLADDVGVRATVELLAGARSIVDVSVYTWLDERWRLLPLADQRKLWELAHPQGLTGPR